MKKTKILVFSDSHGKEHNIETAIKAHGGHADAFIFLGDGLMGANAVVGVDIDYEVLGQNGSMIMVTASGTAVVTE